MQMTAADLAYMKGEAAVQPEDTAADALKRATEHGYLVPCTWYLASGAPPLLKVSSPTALTAPVDWKELDHRTREQLAAEGLNEDCLPIAKPGVKPGEPLTKESLEQMFTPSEEYLALAAEKKQVGSSSEIKPRKSLL